MEKPNIGMIGLAVMGSNLARNIESRGYPVAVYNRTYEVTERFLAQHRGSFVGAKTLEEFVQKMASPRQIFIMVKAGAPTDAFIDQLIPLVEKGDIIIDGGNAFFKDTQRREQKCRDAGVNFMGIGISGGEEGALKGPSLMPGGPRDAWKIMAPLLDKIAAQVDGPCTGYVGPDGAGHFVKMVHNGIEYGDMQLIAEAYDILRRILGCKPEILAETFGKWNDGVLSSYLIEITAKIFARKDDSGQGFLVDAILDAAGQKGTGMWTAQQALELGVAIPTLSAAVDARILSSMKAERVEAERVFPAVTESFRGDRKLFIDQVHNALYASKILAYAQGMHLLAVASREYKWDLKLGEIAAMWRGGCIIRAKFLREIQQAYIRNPELSNLILDPALTEALVKTIPSLREVIITAQQFGIPMIAFSSSLAYYDSYRTASLPQNLTQAQRDFFGAHTYQRVDKEGVYHTEWES